MSSELVDPQEEDKAHERAKKTQGGRVPPNALDAEGAVIATMLLDPSAVDRLIAHGFRAEHCYADANRRIVEGILDLHQQGGEVDVVTLAGWLRDRGRLAQVGGAPYLAQLSDATPAIVHVLEHATMVMEKYRMRRAIDICQLGAATAYGPVESTQEFLENLETSLSEITHVGQAVKVELIGTVASREVKRIIDNKAQGNTMLGLQTGFTDLDRMTGGLMRGNLYVLGARPGMGKTALLSSLLAGISRPQPIPYSDAVEPGHAGMMISIEMSRDQIALRLVCHEAALAMPDVVSGKVAGANWDRLLQGSADLQKWPLWIDDSPTLGLLELHAMIRHLKRRIASGAVEIPNAGLGVVGIDYLQLMRGLRLRGSSREEEVASLSRGLKAMAKEEDVPIICLSQLNRNVEKGGSKDKRPTLSDLRESGAIEQDADSIWFLYREAYYDRSANKNAAEVNIAKQRNGPTGIVNLFYSPEPMRFYNAEKSDWSPDHDENQYWDQK